MQSQAGFFGCFRIGDFCSYDYIGNFIDRYGLHLAQRSPMGMGAEDVHNEYGFSLLELMVACFVMTICRELSGNSSLPPKTGTIAQSVYDFPSAAGFSYEAIPSPWATLAIGHFLLMPPHHPLRVVRGTAMLRIKIPAKRHTLTAFTN